MTTDTGVMAAGTIAETIGVVTTGEESSGARNSGVESKPAEMMNVVVIGTGVMIEPCGTVTRTITATIVASAMRRSPP